MDTEIQSQLADWLSKQTHAPFLVKDVAAIHGGCIHQTYVFDSGDRSYFIKLNHESKLDVFEAEAEGLEALANTATIRAPRPIGCGCVDGHSFLAMERLYFGPVSAVYWPRMGQELAALHHCTADQFGGHRDNYIGSSPQQNTRCDQWTDFFRDYRLRPQFEMAQKGEIQFENANALLEAVASLLGGHHPFPALLHGDLWSGNTGFLEDGSPVVYDPAAYYGDRETDLAFSEFFGGFPPSFYAAYEVVWPLPEGYDRRKRLYNLYHALNHANLFGGSYIQQAQQMIDELLETT